MLERIVSTSAAPATICYPFVGAEMGGSHISALGLIRHLDRSRFRPLVVLQYPDSQIGELFRKHGIDFQEMPVSASFGDFGRIGPRQLATVLADLQPLTRFLRASGVSIVHSNDGRTHATWGIPARLAGAKLFWHHRSDPSSAGLRFFAPFLAHRVVSVSRFAAPRPGPLWSARRSRVIHSPFKTDIVEDREAARADLVAELGCSPETHFVGFFGALVERKRPLLFVDAIAALQRRMPNASIQGLVFGEEFEGFEAALLKRSLDLGIVEQIKLMGFRYPGTRWLAACDLLLVPAVHEPFGRTLIEAMLVGTPVVATDSGGNPEALRHSHTGLLVPPEDAEALASAAETLLITPALYRSVAVTAQADARARFGEERHATAIMEVYDELLAPRRLGGTVLRSQP